MLRKKLPVLITLALGCTVAVQAQAQDHDYDSRWYLASYAGVSFNDNDRLSDPNTLLLGIGFGRQISSNMAVDLFLDRTKRSASAVGRRVLHDRDAMDSSMLGVSVRHFFGDAAWKPYVMAGIGAIHHRSVIEDNWDAGLQLGGGLQYALDDRFKVRAEVAVRHDLDDDSIPVNHNYTDILFNVGMTWNWDASEPVAVAARDDGAPQPEQPSKPEADCHAMDDDQDGVNNCDDRCAASPAGGIVGPDGCPQEVVIDLRGVNFLFDRPRPGQESIEDAGLLPGSKEILDQAVDVLKRYPNVKVDVAGHTDWIGTDAYNQKLSERRASVVYNYLISQGIDAARLMGPSGYGESRPIDTNDTKDGRQRNRRTELAVQK